MVEYATKGERTIARFLMTQYNMPETDDKPQQKSTH